MLLVGSVPFPEMDNCFLSGLRLPFSFDYPKGSGYPSWLKKETSMVLKYI